MRLYPADRLYEEMAFIAYYAHWSRNEVMSLEHRERARWCGELSAINSRINGEEQRKNVFEV